MKAVILAGGKGTRLKPYTNILPKPLLPVGKKPILEIILERLGEHGFKEIILAVEYKAEFIKAYFGSGNGLDVNIKYFQEYRFSGTAGPVRAARHLLDGQPFITMNGDILTDLDFSRMYQKHINESAELTVATVLHTVALPYGVIDQQNGKIVSIREKPDLKFLINAGIYIVSPSALDAIPEGKTFDMPDLIQTLINQGRKVETYLIDGEWQDLGTMENYNKVNLENGGSE